MSKKQIIKVLQLLFCILFNLFAVFGVWAAFGVAFDNTIAGWLAAVAMLFMKELYVNSRKDNERS